MIGGVPGSVGLMLRTVVWAAVCWSFAAAGAAEVTEIRAVVIDASGSPVNGAVVVSSAGGKGVSAHDGSVRFSLEGISSPREERVTAVAVVDGVTLAGSVPVAFAPGGGATEAGVITVHEKGACKPEWIPAFGGGRGVNTGNPDDYVRAITVFDDGSGSGPALYVAGGFTRTGGMTVNHIAKWDGEIWSPLGNGTNATIWSLAVFDDGSGPALFAGGEFTMAGDASANHIAKWDGEAWSPLGSGMSFPGGTPQRSVRALAVYDDGAGPALYAGGFFTMAGGNAASRVAKWDGSAWSALGSGVDGTVFALTVYDDGTGPVLCAGGSFTVDGVAIRELARWDGTAWSGFGGLGPEGTVFSLAVFDDGGGSALYIGGGFEFVDSIRANNIAKWDGTAWSSLGEGTNGRVSSLTVFDDGTGPALYAGGGFSFISGTGNSARIAKWDGNTWTAFDSGLDSACWALASYDDGKGMALYAGGEFTTAGAATANRIAQWDGEEWSALGNGTDGSIVALSVFDDGKGGGPALYAGGAFTTAGGITMNNIARWDGAAWSPLGVGTNGVVRALTVFDDGTGPALYAGGQFSTAGGVSAPLLARWDGEQWSALGNPFIAFSVNALAVFDDGGGPELYAGGSFGLFSPTIQVNNIAKWNGIEWTSPGSGFNGAVHALTAFDDGFGSALYAGGVFQKSGLVDMNAIAMWNGAMWSALGDGLTLPDFAASVQALAEYNDGTGPALYAGGNFSMAGGAPANNIAKWDGGGWSSVGGGIDQQVSALLVHDDGSGSALFATGTFESAGAVVANGTARWDGVQWSALDEGILGRGLALAAFGHGASDALFVAGEFQAAGGVDVNNLAVWGCIVPFLLGDINRDGVVDAIDVQLVINAALGIALAQGLNADVNGDGFVNAVDVQLVINAALGIAAKG